MKTTTSTRPQDAEKNRIWYLMDAAGYPMGRLAAEVAKILRGKHKPTFTPHVDCGDHVIIINADKVRLTGSNKRDEPIYSHTGYPGGLHSISRGREIERNAPNAMRRVVKGMLPHNSLGDQLLQKLRVYSGSVHPHEAQCPLPYNSFLALGQPNATERQEANMSSLTLQTQEEADYGCVQLAVTVPNHHKKYAGGTIFSDHFALWWTTQVKDVNDFWVEAQELASRMNDASKQQPVPLKQFHGVYLYLNSGAAPVQIAKEMGQLPKDITEATLRQFSPDGVAQMLRIATDWGDITYDLRPFQNLPRRISFASHRQSVEGLARLISKTNVTQVSQPEVERIMGLVIGEFRDNPAFTQTEAGSVEHRGRVTSAIPSVEGTKRNAGR